MSDKKTVTTAATKKTARANGKGKAPADKFPTREVDAETLRKVTKLVVEIHRDTLKELANH